jgi:hypothetical protein
VGRFGVLLLVSSITGTSLSAQWLTYPTPGIPRTPEGRPDLLAATPRTREGRIDLTGVWQVAEQRRVRFAGNIPNPAPLTPWARGIREERLRNQGRDVPTAKCLPLGIPPDMVRPFPFKIVQTPAVTVILMEEFNNWRQIFADGRPLPSNPEPAWFGYSIGRWEGDTFVVDSAGFNDKTWLDGTGTPHSGSLHLTERFRRPDFGHLEIDYTFTDPAAFTKPFFATVAFRLLADTDLMDHQCENERDAIHLR